LPAASSSSSGTHQEQIRGEQRVLHALNRLTFGPRPGEVAEVERVGLKQWFDLQLSPEAIDDSALDACLALFPAMALPQGELLRRYPSAQTLRAIVQRNLPLPQDPIEHAIYADGVAFYKEAQARKAEGEGVPAKANENAGMQDPDSKPDTAGAVSSTSMGAQSAPSKRQRGGKIDLLGADSGYSMPGNKKQADAPTTEAEATGQAEMAAGPAANRGRALHNDRLFSEATTNEILALPPDARVLRILALEPAELVTFRRSLSQAELAGVARDLSPQQKEIFAALQGSARMIGAEVLESRIERDVYSRREVEAVITDFWLNHFSVYLKNNQNEPYFLPAYERETIRPYALGRFEDLLVATAKSPAMLMYLDNWQSIGPDSDAAHRGARYADFAKNPQVKQALKDRGLNENYARELMELHTVGVGCEVSKDRTGSDLNPACGKGYTQADVTEVAKVFSGWTILPGWTKDRAAEGGEYSFEERRHQPGKKTVLGQTIHESGEKEGLEVLHMLAMSPATAKFLSTKLAIRFVSDTPSPALIDRMAKSYLASGGEIKAVLRTMFDAPEFWSPEVFRAKVKTPLEFVVSALRSTDANIINAVPVVQSLDRLGMPIYGMQTPNGYSWKAEPWVSTGSLVSRMNFALVLSSDKLPGTRLNWPLLLGERSASVQPVALSSDKVSSSLAASPSAAEEQRLEKMLLGISVSDRTRRAVLSQSVDTAAPRQAEQDFKINGADDSGSIADNPGTGSAGNRQAATMAGLLLGSPEFQRR